MQTMFYRSPLFLLVKLLILTLEYYLLLQLVTEVSPARQFFTAAGISPAAWVPGWWRWWWLGWWHAHDGWVAGCWWWRRRVQRPSHLPLDEEDSCCWSWWVFYIWPFSSPSSAHSSSKFFCLKDIFLKWMCSLRVNLLCQVINLGSGRHHSIVSCSSSLLANFSMFVIVLELSVPYK